MLKVHLYVGTVLWWFQTLSQYWRDRFFQTKVLIGIFTLCWRDCFFWVKNLYRDFFMVLISVAFFFGHLSKVPSVLMGLKTPVLGGVYCIYFLVHSTSIVATKIISRWFGEATTRLSSEHDENDGTFWRKRVSRRY